ncbi:MAG: TIGR03905 family TSCPD domain-containing protein [Lentisphaerae bacterium]|nr:TIGR03905 family TSCPD domain-containing protein [Lentisphaerota bacterium]
MTEFHYETAPEVCSESIDIKIDDSGSCKKIHSVCFNGGCPGSLAAVSALVKNKTPQEAIKLLRGITCGSKNTSCPAQLAMALQIICGQQTQEK